MCLGGVGGSPRNPPWQGVRQPRGFDVPRTSDAARSLASVTQEPAAPAIGWLIQGGPLYFVQRQLGHRDSRTTERYEHRAASYLAERVDRYDDALWLPRTARQEASA
jgi:integrase